MKFRPTIAIFFFLFFFLAPPVKNDSLLRYASTTESQCVATKFNATKLTCFDPKEYTVDPDMIWPVSTHPSRGSCYDKDGVRYSYGYRSTLPSCCGCINYFCSHGSGAKGNFNFWRLRTISPYCCQDDNGVIYPPDEVMSRVTLDDECATEKITKCKHNKEWNKVMGAKTELYTARNCCLDSDGLNPVNTIKLDPSTCSERTCRPGKPTSLWSTCPVIPGKTNCCIYNNTLISNGDVVENQSGVNVTCCDGQMVVKYDVTPPRNCNGRDAIHSSIGFAIDNTGPVSFSSKGVMSLSNGLIDDIIALNYIIPKWVLVTFNYFYWDLFTTTTTTTAAETTAALETTAAAETTTWTTTTTTTTWSTTYSPPRKRSILPTEADIAYNTDLRIISDNANLFRSRLNDITFRRGSNGPRRASQLGLWVTLNNLPKHGIALLFTDHQSKDLDMESALTQLRDEKNIKIFVVLAPKYRATVGDESWNLYKKLSQGRIYDMEDFNATQFRKEVVQVLGETCEENIPPVILA